MLSREEENELIRRWQESRDPQAAERLVEAHRRWVREMAGQFRGSRVLMNDLVQQAWLGFWEAVKRYDPDRNVRLKTYAWPSVRRRLVEPCAGELELSDDGRRAWRTVLDAWERLAQELGRLPTREEVVRRAVPQLIEQERWADHRDRAERAAREVLEALDRKRLPLANDREDEEGEERKPGITPPSPGPGPEEVVINSEQIQAWCQQACKILGPEQGQKWVVAFVLHERKLERTPWEEIAGWLREPDSLVHKFWGTVWEAYGLNGCVPGSWREIQELFAVPPPILSDDLTKSSANLRQWYSRANGELERHGSPRARPPAG